MKATKNTDAMKAGDETRFAALAETWWDEDGPCKPLHMLNPVRLAFLRDTLCAHREHKKHKEDKGGKGGGLRPLAGLRVVDVGCGGGLLSEPLARLGASVTGIDMIERNIAVASAHGRRMGLAIAYEVSGVAAFASLRPRAYDAVLAMEVVEHTADAAAFLKACCALVADDGVFVLSTFNRTALSFVLGVGVAEYVLGWLPRGTHDWRRFLKPGEIEDMLAAFRFRVIRVQGVVFDPLAWRFRLGAKPLVSYMLVAVRGAGG